MTLQPEDFWLNSTRKGIVVFALPREPGLTELVGDYRIHFQDRNGDFYWFVHAYLDIYLFLFLLAVHIIKKLICLSLVLQ